MFLQEQRLTKGAAMAPLRCPVCGKRFEAESSLAMPFCSQRCRLIDLYRWLDEKYLFPGEPADEEPAHHGPQQPDDTP